MTSIVIAITGASGASLGLKFAKTLPSHIHKYIILTKNANVVLEKEEIIIIQILPVIQNTRNDYQLKSILYN